MSQNGTLSNLFKSKEQAVETNLPKDSFTVIRLDGKSFHTFTKRYSRPYSNEFMGIMDQVAQYLTAMIPGAIFGYVQSDEISVLFSDKASAETDPWFGGRVQKIASICSANATGQFMRLSPQEDMLPIFDARMNTLDDLDEAFKYINWRRWDAQKNSISMAAETLRSHKQLMGMNTDQRKALLVGTDLETLPDGFYNGRLILPRTRLSDVTFLDKRTQQMTVKKDVARKVWDIEPATNAAMDELSTILKSFGSE